jgi:UDP-glucuronate decarboxylase
MIDNIVKKDVRRICGRFDEHHFSGKRVLLTGGAGFIGSWLADVLVNLGAIVTCLDNLSTGQIINIDPLLTHQNFRFVQADVSSSVPDEKYDYLLHLASRPSPEDYQQHPIETLLSNSIGSHRMLELTRKMDSRILYTSTSEVYGDAQVIPTPEDYWGNVNPIGPRSCYDEGKRFGEALFMAYLREHDLDVRIARIFNTYGPRIRASGTYARAVPRFIRQALANEPITVYGNGSQTRSLCYISDTVLGLLMLLVAPNAAGEIINIGAADEIRILDLANKIKTMTKSRSQIVFRPLPTDDPKRRCPDISKARRVLGWVPSLDLNGGLERTIEWFEKKSVVEPADS